MIDLICNLFRPPVGSKSTTYWVASSQNGVISIYTFNNPKIIRIMPTLVITEEEVDVVLRAFDLSLAEISAQEERMANTRSET